MRSGKNGPRMERMRTDAEKKTVIIPFYQLTIYSTS
jgi:hypothetical protein